MKSSIPPAANRKTIRRTNSHVAVEPLESRLCLDGGALFLGDLNAQPVTPDTVQMVAARDFVYFTGFSPEHGTELWRTDGTTEGTRLVKDIRPGSASTGLKLTQGYPQRGPASAVIDNLLFFVADDGRHGRELWRSDGTTAGTFLLRDISDELDIASTPEQLHAVGNQVFFAATSPATGRELWKSDGTRDGTRLVKDIVPGQEDSGVWPLTDVNEQLIFAAYGGLWRTDGTAEATLPLRDENGESVEASLGCGHFSCTFGPFKHEGLNRIFFEDGRRRQNGLWVTDGSDEGTYQLNDSRPFGPFSANGDRIFFSAFSPDGRLTQLWQSDGTRSGTQFIRDLPGARLSGFTQVGDTLYFVVRDSPPGRLWKSDGTAQGTQPVDELFWYPTSMGTVGDTFFFSTHATDGIWKANEKGIKQLGTQEASWTATLSGRLVFRDDDKLYAVDEFDESPVLLRDGGPLTRSWVVWKDQVLVAAENGEIWITNGTPAGTQLIVKAIESTEDSSPGPFVSYRGKNYYLAESPTWQLWSHNPNTGAVEVGKSIGGSTVHSLQIAGDQLVFLKDGELWFSDGSLEGTNRVVTSVPITEIEVVEDTLYMATEDGILRGELTGENIVPIVVDDDGHFRSPTDLTAVGDRLFFAAQGGGIGIELWQKKGASAARMVRDIMPGWYGSNPSDLQSLGSSLVFSADDGVHGREVWISDGTSQGTMLLADLHQREVTGHVEIQHIEHIGDATFLVLPPAKPLDLIFRPQPLLVWMIPDDPSDKPQRITSDLFDISQMVGLGDRPLFVARETTSLGTAKSLWHLDDENELKRLNSPSPEHLVVVTNTAYFTTRDGGLWKSDGTNVGTEGLFSPNQSSSSSLSVPTNLTQLGDSLFFVADDGVRGPELWMTRGTANTTRIVRDINPGGRGSDPTDLTVVGESLYFSTDDQFGGRQLWTSDGTSLGTRRVSDIQTAITSSSDPSDFARVGGTTYFLARDAQHGRELWKTDGTAQETQLVADLLPGPRDASIGTLQAVDDRLFFTAAPVDSRSQLWTLTEDKSPSRVGIDNSPDSDFAFPKDLVVLHGQLLFVALVDCCDQGALFRTEVTASGVVARRIAPNTDMTNPTELVVVGDQVYFVANHPLRGRELWLTDGTDRGTKLLKDILNEVTVASSPQQFTQIGDEIYFTAEDATHGKELWRSEVRLGQEATIIDLWPGSGGSTPMDLTEFHGSLVFSAIGCCSDRALWTTDGTPNGTYPITTGTGAYVLNPDELTVVEDTLFLFAKTWETEIDLWAIDKSRFDRAKAVARRNTTRTLTFNEQLVVLGDSVYFAAHDGEHGRELWKSDGTGAGTTMISDLRPVGASALSTRPDRHKLVPHGSKLYFAADTDGRFNNEIWVTDGTAEGTSLVLDPRTTDSQWALPLDAAGDWLYFSAPSIDHGNELWRTDGSVENTQLVADLSPGPASSIFFPHGKFTQLDEEKYLFPAVTADGGAELWVTDGTAAGTYSLNMEPGPESTSFGELVQVHIRDGLAYFFASAPSRGSGLWVSDGTSQGTQLVAEQSLTPWPDLTLIDDVLLFGTNHEQGALAHVEGHEVVRHVLSTPDPTGSSAPSDLTAIGDELYFVANDGVHGREVWKSDGTLDGTRIVVDTAPGLEGSKVGEFVKLGPDVYFTTSSPATGLWGISENDDGTQLRNLQPPSTDDVPHDLVVWNDRLVFLTGSRPSAAQLWISDGTADGTQSLSPLAASDQFRSPRNAVVLHDQLFVLAESPAAELFLWKFETPESLPIRLSNVKVDSDLYRLGDEIYFSADDPLRGAEPWVSDGTVDGTRPIVDVNTTPVPQSIDMQSVNGVVYFLATDQRGEKRLWQTDASINGTRAVESAVQGFTAGDVVSFHASKNGLFVLQVGSGGKALWRIDTSLAEATMLWAESADQHWVRSLLVSGDQFLFLVSDARYGIELWVSDGTPGTTKLVRDIFRGSGSSHVTDLVKFQHGFVFVAKEPTFGRELWFTDGTDAGTIPIADIHAGPEGSEISSLHVVGDRIYFTANDGEHGSEPWVSDGTKRGTRMLINTVTRTVSSDPTALAVVGSELFFAATQDDTRYLWRWNASLAKPEIVNTSVIDPEDLVASGERIYFSGFHPTVGRELWVSDSTAEGTHLLVDTAPGPISSSPQNIAVTETGDIYFSAVDSIHGREPWWLPNLIGDLDTDHDVDFADFLLFAENFGNHGAREQGDLNGDGQIDFVDFLLLSSNFRRFASVDTV